MEAGFSSSKLLRRKEISRARRAHKKRLNRVRPQIDMTPPATQGLPHMRRNLKREQMQEERLSQIAHENDLLVAKMTRIWRGPGDPMLNASSAAELPTASSASLMTHAVKEEQRRIREENLALYRRLQSSRPFYDRHSWEAEWRTNEGYMRAISEFGEAPAAPAPAAGAGAGGPRRPRGRPRRQRRRRKRQGQAQAQPQPSQEDAPLPEPELQPADVAVQLDELFGALPKLIDGPPAVKDGKSDSLRTADAPVPIQRAPIELHELLRRPPPPLLAARPPPLRAPGAAPAPAAPAPAPEPGGVSPHTKSAYKSPSAVRPSRRSAEQRAAAAEEARQRKLKPKRPAGRPGGGGGRPQPAGRGATAAEPLSKEQLVAQRRADLARKKAVRKAEAASRPRQAAGGGRQLAPDFFVILRAVDDGGDGLRVVAYEPSTTAEHVLAVPADDFALLAPASADDEWEARAAALLDLVALDKGALALPALAGARKQRHREQVAAKRAERRAAAAAAAAADAEPQPRQVSGGGRHLTPDMLALMRAVELEAGGGGGVRLVAYDPESATEYACELSAEEFAAAAAARGDSWEAQCTALLDEVALEDGRLCFRDAQALAAAKIQAVARGRHERAEREREAAAATKIQAVARGHHVRAEEAAAVKIQAVARGHHVRAEAAHKAEEEAAAVKIQAVARGRHVRAEAAHAAEEAAAVKIQAVARGHHARKALVGGTTASCGRKIGGRFYLLRVTKVQGEAACVSALDVSAQQTQELELPWAQVGDSSAAELAMAVGEGSAEGALSIS